jgi:hypothetical protein
MFDPAKIAAADKVKWMSRQARRFMGAEPAFDASLDYESDVDGLTTCHPSWVSDESDLTPLGREVRAYLRANPALVEG